MSAFHPKQDIAYLQAPPPGHPVQPGPRTTRPGLAPVCFPPRNTCTPLTMGRVQRRRLARGRCLAAAEVAFHLGAREPHRLGQSDISRTV
jgi:hypothetical protein